MAGRSASPATARCCGRTIGASLTSASPSSCWPADPPLIASRLAFDCTPVGSFLDLPVNGRRVRFTENVFYEFRDRKIAQVWSLIDKVAIEAQL